MIVSHVGHKKVPSLFLFRVWALSIFLSLLNVCVGGLLLYAPGIAIAPASFADWGDCAFGGGERGGRGACRKSWPARSAASDHRSACCFYYAAKKYAVAQPYFDEGLSIARRYYAADLEQKMSGKMHRETGRGWGGCLGRKWPERGGDVGWRLAVHIIACAGLLLGALGQAE